MKIGILREGKIPSDNRVALTPVQCVEVQEKYPDIEVFIQPSGNRCFSDDEYIHQGIVVQEDLSSCDILMGVKEVPIDELIPDKTYLFFSHTIKMQTYNKELLKAIINLNIWLVDYEVLTDQQGNRIIGFGWFAGVVGAYNGLRALGLRNKLFNLTPAYETTGFSELVDQLQNVKIPPVKIAVTGDGRVASGVTGLLDLLYIKKLSPEQYLKVNQPEYPVYTQLETQYYVRRKDGKKFNLSDFFNHPELYENTFFPFTGSTDMLITAAYWNPKAPVLFSSDEMKKNDFRIKIVSDITCDIDGSVPSTKRASTIEVPFYDYNPFTGNLEPPFSSDQNITVQAVDNLPNELPREASQDFGRNLIDKVFPSLLIEDAEGIIERATVAKDGVLSPRFSYLYSFVNS